MPKLKENLEMHYSVIRSTYLIALAVKTWITICSLGISVVATFLYSNIIKNLANNEDESLAPSKNGCTPRAALCHGKLLCISPAGLRPGSALGQDLGATISCLGEAHRAVRKGNTAEHSQPVVDCMQLHSSYSLRSRTSQISSSQGNDGLWV